MRSSGGYSRWKVNRPIRRPSGPGTRLVTVLEVTPGEQSEARLMVDDPLPAGFEIDNPNLLRGGDIRALDWLEVLTTWRTCRIPAGPVPGRRRLALGRSLPAGLCRARGHARQLPPPRRQRRGHVSPDRAPAPPRAGWTW
jgi:hypothetical protein